MRRNIILFDLDGTLTDSGPGIMKAGQYALRAFGIERDWRELSFFVGPPLSETVARFVSAENVDAAVADHHSAGKIVAASRFKRGFDDIYLFARFLVALGRAADGVEVGCEAEMLQNALGHGVEFRRGDEKTLALALEMRKQRGMPG